MYRPQSVNGKSFCHRTLSYIDSYDDCLKKPSLAAHACAPGQMFSFAKRACVNTQNGTMYQGNAVLPENITYAEVRKIQFTFDVIGKHFVPSLFDEDIEFELEAGDLIGYHSKGTRQIRQVQPQTTREGDLCFSEGVVPGDESITISSQSVQYQGQYLFRAVTIKPSRLHVGGTYPESSTLVLHNIIVEIGNVVSNETTTARVFVEDEIDNVTLSTNHSVGKLNLIINFISWYIIWVQEPLLKFSIKL